MIFLWYMLAESHTTGNFLLGTRKKKMDRKIHLILEKGYEVNLQNRDLLLIIKNGKNPQMFVLLENIHAMIAVLT